MRTKDKLIDRARELAAKGDPGLIAVDFFLFQIEGLQHAIDVVRNTPTCGSPRILHRLEAELQHLLRSQ